MTRQEQFKAELFDLLRRYKVEMELERESDGYNWKVIGINFWSSTQYDQDGTETAGAIDLTVGTWCNGEE